MRIIKILKPVKYGVGDTYVSVPVQLDDGSTGFVYIGGECEAYFHNGVTKVHIKRNKS